MFGKKSPVAIVKEDWKKEIEENTLQVKFLEKYMWAYDISRAYSLTRIHDYSSIVDASIMQQEDKFENVAHSITLISGNYLAEFYEFMDSGRSGRIWNGTIDSKIHLTYHIMDIP